MLARGRPYLVCVLSIAAPSLLSACWTSDAHEINDAGQGLGLTCPITANSCVKFLPPPSAPLLDDFSKSSADTPTTTAYNQFQFGDYGAGASGTLAGGIFIFPTGPTPSADAGLVSVTDAGADAGAVGFAKGQWLVTSKNGDFMHIEGPLNKSAGWGFYLQLTGSANPPPCAPASLVSPNGMPFVVGGGIDASAYQGVTVPIKGYAGPSGHFTFSIDSLGTPEDASRIQTINMYVPVTSNLTTLKFKWSDFTVTCGKLAYFNSGRITSFHSSFDLKPGPTYYLSIDIGSIGFIPN